MSTTPANSPMSISTPYWRDPRSLKVLGMGTAVPGPAVSTTELLERVEARFRVPVIRRGGALADRLGIKARHICRDFVEFYESPRLGHANPDLAAAALRAALEEAQLEIDDLAYLIGHTTSPARLAPPNIALVADRVGFTGPYMELRQACTGFANALVIAQGLVSAPGAKPIALVGSETGSVYFDPRRASEDVRQLVSPATAIEVLIGKLSPYIIIGVVQAAVVIGIARMLFELPVMGNVWALLIAVPLYAAAHLILGFAFSALAENQLQAMQGAVFFYLPSMLLSGFMFPFQGMPRWAQIVGETLPLTHFVRAARGVLLKGEGAALVLSEMTLVALFALIAAGVALAAYRRRID